VTLFDPRSGVNDGVVRAPLRPSFSPGSSPSPLIPPRFPPPPRGIPSDHRCSLLSDRGSDEKVLLLEEGAWTLDISDHDHGSKRLSCDVRGRTTQDLGTVSLQAAEVLPHLVPGRHEVSFEYPFPLYELTSTLVDILPGEGEQVVHLRVVRK